MTRIQLLSSVLIASSSLVTAAIHGAPHYVDPEFITESLKRTQKKHQSAIDALHYNEQHHPELFEQREAMIRQAHKIERRAAKRQAAASGERGVVELTDFFSEPLDIMVYTSVSIGTPAQSLPVLIDTGSADLWVYKEGVGQIATPEWDASISSTAVVEPAIPWSIQYGSGSQQGFLNQDVVSMGGYSADTVFASATTLNQAFQPYPISGIFGFGFGVISASGYQPWFERLLNSSQLANPLFSLALIRAQDLTAAPQGSIAGAQLCVGCVDATRYTGDISWNPVTSVAFWTIAMDGIALNGTIIPGTAVSASLDSGTTLIQIPVAAANAMYAAIGGVSAPQQGEGAYIIPCDTPIGSFAFVFKGIAYEIPPEDLIQAISRDGSACILTIQGADNTDSRGNPTSIIGGAFLKNTYTIFSYSYQGAPAVGLARSTIAGSWNTTSDGFSVSATGTISVSNGPVAPSQTSAQISVTSGGLMNSSTSTTTTTATTTTTTTTAQTQATVFITEPVASPTSTPAPASSSAALKSGPALALASLLSTFLAVLFACDTFA